MLPAVYVKSVASGVACYATVAQMRCMQQICSLFRNAAVKQYCLAGMWVMVFIVEKQG